MKILLASLLLASQIPPTPVPSQVPLTPLQPRRPFDQIALHPIAPLRNVVVIIADDFGVDLVGAYGEGATPPCTPNIDSLAAGGLLFRNAWGSPVCSPARASILTGRYPFRTGIGNVLLPADAGLSLSELTLPEALVWYDSSCVGKWHLSGNLPATHPNDSGFGYYAGCLEGGVGNYTSWDKTTNGTTTTGYPTYATIDTADEAISRMSAMTAPWLLFVAFNAPHTPYHVPDPASCPSSAPCASTWCSTVLPGSSNLDKGKAAVEAMDTEIGRVLAALAQQDPNAYVFFLGDNGSAGAMTESPFNSAHAKDTLYEGGINVPLIVKGPGVVVGECAALVSTADLFATIGRIGGHVSSAEDSVSFYSCLSNPAARPRTTVYAEKFTPNGGTLPFDTHDRAVRNVRYKLIRQSDLSAGTETDEFYDLWLDPFEAVNLIGGLTAFQQYNFNQLEGQLVALGVD